MEAIVFVGIQGAGKSTFYIHRFFNTHVRINLDMLKTRHREAILLDACLKARQRFVVDNTNVTRDDRARYLSRAKAAGFKVTGYFFEPDVDGSLARNRQRTGRACIPDKGVLGTLKRLQRPAPEEGFDMLYVVRLLPEIMEFSVSPYGV